MRPNKNTPTETYKAGGKKVWVKREDLQGDDEDLPPWGKLLYVRKLIQTLPDDRPVVALNVYGSWAGWALSAFCKEADIECHVCHPNTKLIHPDYLGKIEENGAKLISFRPNMMRVLYAQMKNYATKDNDYQLLPYAFNCGTYLKALAGRAYTYLNDSDVKFSNLVVSSGSGVSTTALTKAFLKYNPKGKVYAPPVSSPKSVLTLMRQRGIESNSNIIVPEKNYEFNNLLIDKTPPFPCNQFWDKKAWLWLEDNIADLKGKTLFWNLGGVNTFVYPYRSVPGAKYVTK